MYLYLSLCLRARPDHATEIRQVFANASGGPTFAVIDAIGGGVSWPQLRATLRVESGREILAALLASTLSAQAQTAPAGDYPNRFIKIVVPYSAGGGTDVTTRVLAPRLAERMGQPVM